MTDFTDANALVLVAADAVDDIERVRKATTERLRSLTHDEVNGERGGWYGKALPDDHPAVMTQAALLEAFEKLERQAIRTLEKAVADHPLGEWVESTKGIGFKAIGRLLAAIGDPTQRQHVSQLFAYCGVAGPGYRRQKGVKSNWNAVARMRLYVVAESAYRQGRYRDVYLAGRSQYEDAVHTEQCQNHVRPPGRSNGCGTTAHPEWGAPGSPLRDGHKHSRALRLVMREILRDLWTEANSLTGPSQEESDAQLVSAGPGHIPVGMK